jgi:hypothetical protein
MCPRRTARRSGRDNGRGAIAGGFLLSSPLAFVGSLIAVGNRPGWTPKRIRLLPAKPASAAGRDNARGRGVLAVGFLLSSPLPAGDSSIVADDRPRTCV